MKKKIIPVAVGLAAILFALPVAATLALSFWDGRATLGQWKDLLFDCFIFYPMFWNSIFYSVVITLLQLLFVIPCAFGLVMARFRLKKLIYWMYLVLMMMPLQVTILPNYIGLRDMNLLNTRTGIILPMVFSAFGVVVMYQYLEKIDVEQIEAARLETNSICRILVHIVIPDMKVCIFAVILFSFAESYNMLEQPMLFLDDARLQNLTVFIASAADYEGDVLFPAAVLFMVPMLILFLFFNHSLESGLTLGNLREREGR